MIWMMQIILKFNEAFPNLYSYDLFTNHNCYKCIWIQSARFCSKKYGVERFNPPPGGKLCKSPMPWSHWLLFMILLYSMILDYAAKNMERPDEKQT